MRVPVAGYSLDIGKAHTDFVEAKLQQRLAMRKLSDDEINQLAIVAMAGATAEAMNYDQARLSNVSMVSSSWLLCKVILLPCKSGEFALSCRFKDRLLI